MPQGFIVKWNGPDAIQEFDEPYLEIEEIVDGYGPRRNNGDPVAPVLVECKCTHWMMDYDPASECYICNHCNSRLEASKVYDWFHQLNLETYKELEDAFDEFDDEIYDEWNDEIVF